MRTNTNYECITFSFVFPQFEHTLTKRNQMRKNVFETDRKAHCNGMRYRCELPRSLANFDFCSVSTNCVSQNVDGNGPVKMPPSRNFPYNST